MASRRIESKVKSCYGCEYKLDKYCTWFPSKKIIPENVIDKGCKFRKSNKDYIITDNEILENIIETFNGEII